MPFPMMFIVHEHAILLALIVWPVRATSTLPWKQKSKRWNNAGCQKFCSFKMKSAWCQLRLKTWCCTAVCGHVKMKAWIQVATFMLASSLGRIPILLIAGDFLQIKPANEISLADNLEELVRKRPDKVQTEHYAAQAALMSIETVIHLKKSKRFQDVHLPEITTAMRTRTPAAPLSEDHMQLLRMRKIEHCKKELETDFFKNGHVVGMYWENIARSFWLCFGRYAAMFDACLFIYVCDRCYTEGRAGHNKSTENSRKKCADACWQLSLNNPSPNMSWWGSLEVK